MANPPDLAGKAREAWEKNAAWWDEYIGADGNAFHRELIAPSQLRLLDLSRGERVLDIACGNGQFAREMAQNGADVVAFDRSETFMSEQGSTRKRQASRTSTIALLTRRTRCSYARLAPTPSMRPSARWR